MSVPHIDIGIKSAKFITAQTHDGPLTEVCATVNGQDVCYRIIGHCTQDEILSTIIATERRLYDATKRNPGFNR